MSPGAYTPSAPGCLLEGVSYHVLSVRVGRLPWAPSGSDGPPFRGGEGGVRKALAALALHCSKALAAQYPQSVRAYL